VSENLPLELGDDRRRASLFLHQKDPTGGLLATVLFMDSVENWVINRLALDDADPSAEGVRERQRKLSEVLTTHRDNVPPDNAALLQLLVWMKSSEAFYALDYLTQFRPEFTVQFVNYCKDCASENVNASFALERIAVLWRTRLLDRVFSPENLDFVMKIILESCV